MLIFVDLQNHAEVTVGKFEHSIQPAEFPPTANTLIIDLHLAIEGESLFSEKSANTFLPSFSALKPFGGMHRVVVPLQMASRYRRERASLQRDYVAFLTRERPNPRVYTGVLFKVSSTCSGVTTSIHITRERPSPNPRVYTGVRFKVFSPCRFVATSIHIARERPNSRVHTGVPFKVASPYRFVVTPLNFTRERFNSRVSESVPFKVGRPIRSIFTSLKTAQMSLLGWLGVYLLMLSFHFPSEIKQLFAGLGCEI